MEATPSVTFQFEDGLPNEIDQELRLSEVKYQYSITNQKKLSNIYESPNLRVKLAFNPTKQTERYDTKSFSEEFSNNYRIFTNDQKLNSKIHHSIKKTKDFSLHSQIIDTNINQLPSQKQVGKVRIKYKTKKSLSKFERSSTVIKNKTILSSFDIKKNMNNFNKQNVINVANLIDKSQDMMQLSIGWLKTSTNSTARPMQYFTSKATPGDARIAKRAFMKYHTKHTLPEQNSHSFIHQSSINQTRRLKNQKFKQSTKSNLINIFKKIIKDKSCILQKLPLIR